MENKKQEIDEQINSLSNTQLGEKNPHAEISSQSEKIPK